ncbi:nanos homolog 1-like [Galendromus occidentalis]|uniref:Nanos homolog 1-like n=1 Tax=Galendromus occidentalis TaxID=34638 RepID=A0AAJ6QYY2_9ACAR|nr:nanos homolog 1-like [Galendromus occidentalis]
MKSSKIPRPLGKPDDQRDIFTNAGLWQPEPRAILRRFEPGECTPLDVGSPTAPPPPRMASMERTIDVTLDCSIENGRRYDTFCVFCRNNRLPEEFYRSHPLKDNRGNVVCPILRNYNCPSCNNGGGDRAHTVNYCPKKRAQYFDSFMKGQKL